MSSAPGTPSHQEDPGACLEANILEGSLHLEQVKPGEISVRFIPYEDGAAVLDDALDEGVQLNCSVDGIGLAVAGLCDSFI